MTTTTREKARAQMRIGLCRTVVRPWYEDSLKRRTVKGEILRVLGVDVLGDPIFGDRSSGGSVYADDFLGRTADPAAEDSEPDVVLGACYQDPSDGEIVRVVSVEPTPAIVEDAPAEDRKPRGVKPALALIPWEVMPEHLCPEVARESTDPERVISILFELEGDAFLDDVARAFEHGAAKYGVDNWRGIEWTEKAALEYRSAMLRHLFADAIGERLDPDSGVSHRAHACASAMIHTYRTRREAGEEGSR